MIKIKYPCRTSDEFASLVADYKSIFSKKLLQKEAEWRSWKLAQHVTNIPETVEELLCADVDVLSDVYDRFVSLGYPVSVKDAAGETVRNPVLKPIDKIFNYTHGYDGKIARFFENYADKLGIGSCNYCETAYINVYTLASKASSILKSENRHHFDLDHFLPKSICPIVGLSLFNFVPSCQVCNSRIKMGGVLGTTKAEWEKFNPASKDYSFDDNVSIRLRMHRGPDTSFRNRGEYYIHFRCKNGFDTLVNFFHLEERYDFHKVEAMRIKQLKARYPRSARVMIAGLLKTSEKRVKEDLFRIKFLTDNNRCFAKLTRDMLK